MAPRAVGGLGYRRGWHGQTDVSYGTRQTSAKSAMVNAHVRIPVHF